MRFKKKEIIAYLDADRSAELEIELDDDIIVFLEQLAKELSKKSGRDVSVGDTVGLILKAYIEEQRKK